MQLKKFFSANFYGLLLFLILALLAGSCSQSATSFKSPLRVLVFSKTEGYRHESIGAGKQALLAMGKKHDFAVDTTEDASVFRTDVLEKYQVVVFLNTTKDVLDDVQQYEFRRFIQAGGGFVGVHAAADTEYKWPWYGGLVGAYFKSHPEIQEAKIDVTDAGHVSTSMLPGEWIRTDEWYNYRDLSSNLNVLLKLDESSYKGGENGENHPIAWYHEYDGGRAFYTGLGHTKEAYEEKLFLEHLWGGIQYAAGDGSLPDYTKETVAPEENRFVKDVLDENFEEPMELEILPDGKLLFVQRRGQVRTHDPKTGETKVILNLPVNTKFEDGLLGVALDPDFEKNNWIYLYYSAPEKSVNRLSRFDFIDGYFDLRTEKMLLEVATQRDECCHAGGSVEFGPDGLLYVSTGDNTNPFASNGYSPSDEQPGRSPWDAQKSSANTNDLRGKILRIKPEADGTYSIPEGNLFAPGTAGARPEIYVMGCRNPFRIHIDKRTGYLYWGDVGPDANENGPQRGPRGHDEVNQARQAGFFGWPYFVGDNKPYYRYDFATKTSYEQHDPTRPINRSPNNTGLEELPPAQPAYIWYPYAGSEEFPLMGAGGRNAMAGFVYYYDDYPDNPGKLPRYYDGKLFTYDWIRGRILVTTMDEEGAFVSMERFLPSLQLSNLIDVAITQEGEIYLLEYGKGWFSKNEDARISHLKFYSGNRNPIAQIEVDKPIGGTPHTVSLSAAKSRDFDQDKLTYTWYVEGEKEPKQGARLSHTFNNTGVYTVRLVVKDARGAKGEAEVEIMAGNEPPEVELAFAGNRSFYWDDRELDYELQVSDREDGDLGQEIDAGLVSFTIDYLPEGNDPTEIAMGHQTVASAAQAAAGRQLMENSDCYSCHKNEKASIGPTYREVAERYSKDPEALGVLASRIIRGTSGNWGEAAMSAHPTLTQADAQQMVRYILSLAASPTAESIPVKGAYKFARHLESNTQGAYYLTASYTDQGNGEIRPLTAREEIILRHPRVSALAYSDSYQVRRMTVTEETAGNIPDGLQLLRGDKGGYAVYKDIDLTDVAGIDLGLFLHPERFQDGRVEVRLDAPDGTLLESIPVTHNKAEMTTVKVPLPVDLNGIHNLYFLFESEGAENRPVCGVEYLYFNNRTASLQSRVEPVSR